MRFGQRFSAGAAFVAIAAAAVAVPAVGTLAAPAAADEPKAVGERSFVFDYSVEVKDIPAGAKRLDLWIPLPIEHELQSVESVTIRTEPPVSFQSTSDPEGNRLLHITAEAPLPPSFVILVEYDIARRGAYRLHERKGGEKELPDEWRRRYLAPDKLAPIDGEVASLAKKLIDDARKAGKKVESPIEKARVFYDYVMADFVYKKEGEGWGRGDVKWCLENKYGNCSDYHSTFIALCRASRIPARFTIGFPLPKDKKEGTVGGYHCWAEFYVPGTGWVPVDASEADKNPELTEPFFGGLDENRVQLTIGRDLTLVPPQKGDPLNFFIYPYAEVDGKKIEGAKGTFKFKDL